jgi:hypothetical protein
MSDLNKKPPVMSPRQAEQRREMRRKNVVRAWEAQAEKKAEKREKDFRRLLKGAGYNLKKTPPNHWTREHYGVGYLVTDDRNVVVCGAAQREYDATLLQVACFMEGIGLQPGV